MTISSDFLLFHFHVAATLMATLALVNVYIPRRYHWREEMAALSLLNRQIFQAHTVFIVLTLVMFSVLLTLYGRALLEPTALARAILAGLTVFWSVRAGMQWCFYSPDIWRGDRFNTRMHYVFSAMWLYFVLIFAVAWSHSLLMLE